MSAALHARYVPAASLFWVALGALALIAARKRRAEGAPIGFVDHFRRAVLVGLAIPFVYVNVKALDRNLPPNPEQARCARAFPETREAACLRGLIPGPGAPDPANPEHRWFFETLERLARNRLALFAEDPAP